MIIDEAFVMFAAGFGVGCISIIVLIGGAGGDELSNDTFWGLCRGFIIGAGLMFMAYEFVITPLALQKLLLALIGGGAP